jgi:cellulose biosynthesis protein BcsQ
MEIQILLTGSMITVAVVNRKGGPGKTTVAILAAIGLHENGARVGAIDADHEQGSLTNSLFGSEIEVNPSNLEALDFLVVDTGSPGVTEPKAALRCSVLWTALTPRV